MTQIVDHIAILVDDLDLAEEWYTSQLNAAVSFKDSKYIRIKVQNTNIALIDKKHYPYAHIGILVNDVNNLPADGLRVEHRDGTIGVYVEDPFGNYLEYIWYSDQQKEVFVKDG